MIIIPKRRFNIEKGFLKSRYPVFQRKMDCSLWCLMSEAWKLEVFDGNRLVFLDGEKIAEVGGRQREECYERFEGIFSGVNYRALKCSGSKVTTHPDTTGIFSALQLCWRCLLEVESVIYSASTSYFLIFPILLFFWFSVKKNLKNKVERHL